MIDTNRVPEMKETWQVKWGTYGNDGFTLFTSKTLCRAVALIKKEGGFKYNKKVGLWENDDKCQWYSINKLEYLP